MNIRWICLVNYATVVYYNIDYKKLKVAVGEFIGKCSFVTNPLFNFIFDNKKFLYF